MGELWKRPPLIKLYEALGALGDERVVVQGQKAIVWSSSRQKFYDITCDAQTGAIMSNDNGSFWQGYLGYPSISYVLATGLVPYDHELARVLAGIPWKKLNKANKNDWALTEQEVRAGIVAKHPGYELARFDRSMTALMDAVMALGLKKLGPRTRPPAGD